MNQPISAVASSPTRVRRRVLEPRSGWQPIDWRELLAYKDLLFFLVRRDVRALYAQTVLGFAWAVIRPVFSMIVFSIVFGGLARVPSDGVPYPIFAFAALVPWTYFATAMTGASTSLIGSANLINKIYFPRLFIPMTPVLASLVDFGIALVVLGFMMLGYGIAPTGWVVALPLLILLMVLTTLGVGMWLSALAIRYRDVKHGIQFLVQLMMYAAPVVWPASLITERFPEWGATIRLAYGLYPMAGVIEGFRAALFGTRPMPWDLIAVGSLSAIVLVVTGALYFQRMERVFADVG